jgi:hypothetical protein
MTRALKHTAVQCVAAQRCRAAAVAALLLAGLDSARALEIYSTGRQLSAQATAENSGTIDHDEQTAAFDNRWGLATVTADAEVTTPRPDDMPWLPETTTISANARISTDVRPHGIVVASHVDELPPAPEIGLGGSTALAQATIALTIDEAFDGYLRLGRSGRSSVAGAHLKNAAGESVWALSALEETAPILWNDELLAWNTPVDVSWHFDAGDYTLSFSHHPEVVASTTGPSSVLFWIVPQAAPPSGGDFDGDGSLTTFDIDLLTRAVALSSIDTAVEIAVDLLFDLNNDGRLTQLDHGHWVTSLAQTYFGDATLDRLFNSSDLVQVFVAGKYEDGLFHSAGWSEGDWNGDGEFDAADLSLAFQSGVYEQQRIANVGVVPEPATQLAGLLGIAALCGAWTRRGRRSN